MTIRVVLSAVLPVSRLDYNRLGLDVNALVYSGKSAGSPKPKNVPVCQLERLLPGTGVVRVASTQGVGLDV